MIDDRSQRELPFAEAEGTRAERKNLLGLAMLKVGVDACESRLMEWVFNITDGGTRGHLRKTLEELRATPWGMCCSEDKARSSVKRMKRRGLLCVEETYLGSGAQGPNCYVVNWDGIRDVLCLPSVFPTRTPLAPSHPPGSLPATPGSLPATPGSLPATPIIGISLFETSSWPAGQSRECLKSQNKVAASDHKPASGEWSSEDRSTVVAALHSAGYDTEVASRLARESETELRRLDGTSLSAADVLRICQEFMANRSLFRQAGALGYRLRKGSWPVNGVVPLNAARATETRRDESRKVRESETELFRIVKACREAKVPDDEIRRRVRERLPEAVCVAAGW